MKNVLSAAGAGSSASAPLFGSAAGTKPSEGGNSFSFSGQKRSIEQEGAGGKRPRATGQSSLH